MNTEQIKSLLQQCGLKELLEIECFLESLINNSEYEEPLELEGNEELIRREPRAFTKIFGILTRLTDIQPGEAVEYNAQILDLSRHGMRLRVNHDFCPSRIIKVNFPGPKQTWKESFLEVVRTLKKHNRNEQWLELGCRSISEESARLWQSKEKKITRLQNKLQQRSSLLILVIGLYNQDNVKFIAHLKSEGYLVQHLYHLHQLIQGNNKYQNANLAIFCTDSLLSDHLDTIEEIKIKRPSLATLAIIKSEQDRSAFFTAGIDECIIEENCEELILPSIERAVISRQLQQNNQKPRSQFHILVISDKKAAMNIICHYLEQHQYNCQKMDSTDNIKDLSAKEYDLVLADFNLKNPEIFVSIQERFSGKPIIALTEDIKHGQQAQALGAENYLSIPPNLKHLQMIIENLNAKRKVSSS